MTWLFLFFCPNNFICLRFKLRWITFFRCFDIRWGTRFVVCFLIVVILELRQYLFVVILIWVWVNCQCPTKIFSHINKHFDVEMESFVQPLRWTTETGFACVRIYQVEFFPHYYSPSWLFCFLNGKRWTLIAKIWTDLIIHHWKNFFF